MLNLLAALLSSASVSVLMRLGEGRIKNNYAMFAANYLVCSLISAGFTFSGGGLAAGVGSASGGHYLTLLLGVVSGAMYLFSFVLLKLNIGKNGVMLASVFMKLGVLVPLVIAMLAFGEKPTLAQLAALALAVSAILIIYIEPNGTEKKKKAASASWLLIVLLAAGGLTESLANIYEKLGSAEHKNLYMLLTFASALVISLVMLAARRERVTSADILFGALIGVPNYFSTRFLLGALSELPAIVVYPVYNIGAIVLIALAGFLIFRERLPARKLVGCALILAALVLLNLSL